MTAPEEIINYFNNRLSELNARISYLENSEYSQLNYYGGGYIPTPSWVTLTNSNYIIIPSMVAFGLNGFTFLGSTVTCVQSGQYLVNYSTSVQYNDSVTFYFILLLNSVGVDSSHSRISGSSGDFVVASSTNIISLDVGDTISLAISSPNFTCTAGLRSANYTLHRIGDN
jgi:hypothetical protein